MWWPASLYGVRNFNKGSSGGKKVKRWTSWGLCRRTCGGVAARSIIVQGLSYWLPAVGGRVRTRGSDGCGERLGVPDFPHGEGLAYPTQYVGAQLSNFTDENQRRIMRDNLENFLTRTGTVCHSE